MHFFHSPSRISSEWQVSESSLFRKDYANQGKLIVMSWLRFSHSTKLDWPSGDWILDQFDLFNTYSAKINISSLLQITSYRCNQEIHPTFVSFADGIMTTISFRFLKKRTYRPGQPNWEFWQDIPMWKFSNFPAIQILREIKFGWLQKVKNCHFGNFEGFEFWFSA